MQDKINEISEKLSTLGLPVAYLKFEKPQKLPFIAYLESGTKIFGADGKNLIRRTDYTIELYSEKKIPSIERQIESLFDDVEITKLEDAYIESERMLKITFIFSYFERIKGGK